MKILNNNSLNATFEMICEQNISSAYLAAQKVQSWLELGSKCCVALPPVPTTLKAGTPLLAALLLLVKSLLLNI